MAGYRDRRIISGAREPGGARDAYNRPEFPQKAVNEILVAVKRVVDFNVKVRVKADARASRRPTSRCR